MSHFRGHYSPHYRAAATVQADDGGEDGVVVPQEVVGKIGSLRVQLTDLQDRWFWGVTEQEELKMSPGFGAQTAGRIELKFA